MSASTDPILSSLLEDLSEETRALRHLLGNLDHDEWGLSTPAEGWSIHDQLSHLMYFDESAALAVTDPDRFIVQAAELASLRGSFVDRIAEQLRSLPSAEVLFRWDEARSQLIRIYSGQDRRRRIPWYGPDMSIMSAATARLMETWAHGVDIADALNVPVGFTTRLRHVAHLGVNTRRFSFANHGLDAPTHEVRVDLEAGDGEVWTFGPVDAADRVTGPALDFCLVVTQRRSRTETGLSVTGPTAAAWMAVAQAFAGPPTTRASGQS